MAEDGAVRQVASAGEPMDWPRGGWAETVPTAWWLATRRAVAKLSAAHLRAIDAIGIAGQMHGVVLTGEDGSAVRPAILWADARSTGEVDRYRRLDSALLHRLANPPATGMAWPNPLWLKNPQPSAFWSGPSALPPK